MVNSQYAVRENSLESRLQRKFKDRTAAIRNNAGGTKTAEQPAVMSFFGRTGDIYADREIPRASEKSTPNRVGTAHTEHTDRGDVRFAVRDDRRRTSANSVNVSRQRRPVPSPEIVASFARAYSVGEGARRTAGTCQTAPRARRNRRDIPDGILRKGRSNIPSSRHAVLKTYDDESGKRDFRTLVMSLFKTGNPKAEHKIKKEHIPVGLIAALLACTLLIMLLVYSFSQVQYYTREIGVLEDRKTEIRAETAKIELMIEEKDKITDIEKTASDKIGMVKNDADHSRFVSVSTPDRVEVMDYGDEKQENGFYGLLSSLAENFSEISDYFN